MKPAEVIAQCRDARVNIESELLRFLAGYAIGAELNSGARVLDASDFKEWLDELAEAAEGVMA